VSVRPGDGRIVQPEAIRVATEIPDPALVAREHEHVERLRASFQAFPQEGPGGRAPVWPSTRPRGPASQKDRRAAEWAVKMAAVNCSRHFGEAGLTWQERALGLGVPDRTLREWDSLSRRKPLTFDLRGRPTTRSPLLIRRLALDILRDLGPHIGLRSLRPLVPLMGCRELEDLLRRWKGVYAFMKRRGMTRLIWTVPGTVWALDHTEPPEPIDGIYPYILSVRDLASGCALAWEPVLDMTARTTNQVLLSLFRGHTPPLAIKADCGPWGKAAVTDVFLADWGVTKFLSPPHYPPYNGAAEAGIGSGKTRTGEHARRRSNSEEWTCEDCYAALQEANTVNRPRRLGGLTPQDVWDARPPITQADRLSFLQTLATSWREIRDGHLEGIEGELGARALATLERKAIIRALVACGLLEYRRRRVSLLILRLFLAKDA